MDLEKLNSILSDAQEVAYNTIVLNNDDSGTCNLDCVVINIGDLSRKDQNLVLKNAFVGERLTSKWWRGSAWLNITYPGMAGLRTRAVERVHKFLKDKGVDSTIYYQMD